MDTQKKIIFTADDFGANSSVNRAVLKSFKEGILSHASLMVDEPCAQEAVLMAKDNPGLGVGLHAQLCSENPGSWGLRYFFSPSHRRRIEPEIRRQIDKFLSFGLKPSHVDSHFHIHVHPVIFPIMAGLAREYGIPRIRLPAGEWRPSRSYDRKQAMRRFCVAMVFGALERYLRPLGQGLDIPEQCYGLLRSGLMKRDYLEWLIRQVPQGTTEIYLHPCDDPTTSVKEKPTDTHYSVLEMESLLDADVREALEEFYRA